MIKQDELNDPNSCLNKAQDDEFIFVLRERDPTMANTIEFWKLERIKLGLNKSEDKKLTDAQAVIDKLRERSKMDLHTLTACPFCKAAINATYSAGSPKPEVGDVSICVVCSGILVVDEDGLPRLPTHAEYQRIRQSPEWDQVRDMQIAVRKSWTKEPTDAIHD